MKKSIPILLCISLLLIGIDAYVSPTSAAAKNIARFLKFSERNEILRSALKESSRRRGHIRFGSLYATNDSFNIMRRSKDYLSETVKFAISEFTKRTVPEVIGDLVDKDQGIYGNEKESDIFRAVVESLKNSDEKLRESFT